MERAANPLDELVGGGDASSVASSELARRTEQDGQLLDRINWNASTVFGNKPFHSEPR
jgi:hypothetical protein